MKCSITIALIAISALSSWGCSCPPNTNTVIEVASSDEIFVGECSSATLDGDMVTYQFDRIQLIAGAPTDTKVLQSHRSYSACGYKFTVGDKYIVFATLENSLLSTSLCRRNRRLETKEQEADEIAKVKAVFLDETLRGEMRALRENWNRPQHVLAPYGEPGSASDK